MSPKPKLPYVGAYIRNYGTLVKIEDVTPKEVVLDYIFEDTKARLEARINGHVVKVYGTLNNFYGKDSCVANAINDATRIQEKIGESNLEFVVIKVTSQIRMRPSRHNLSSAYDPKVRDMDTIDYGCKRDVAADVEREVWSSLRGFLVFADQSQPISPAPENCG